MSDTSFSLETSTGGASSVFDNNIKDVIDTLSTIGELYLHVYDGEQYPYIKEKKTDVLTDRQKMLVKGDDGFLPRYVNALKSIAKDSTFTYSPLHMVGMADNLRDSEKNKRSFSIPPDVAKNMSSLSASLETTEFKYATNAMMAMLAQRQVSGRMANGYPLCLFMAPMDNIDGEISKRRDNAEITSMRRYDRIVFTSADTTGQVHDELQSEPIHWVAFAILNNTDYWSKNGSYIKVWTNLDPETMSVNEDTYKAARKEIGESVLSRWNVIRTSFLNTDGLFHSETIFANSSPVNASILRGGDIHDGDSFLHGRMINWTSSRDVHSIFWPMTQCSMDRGLDMFTRDASSDRLYTLRATGQNKKDMTDLVQKFPVGDMSASLLWTTGMIVKGVVPYIRHTSVSYIKGNGYNLRDKDAKAPDGSSYTPEYSASELVPLDARARPHMTHQETKMVCNAVKKTWRSVSRGK